MSMFSSLGFNNLEEDVKPEPLIPDGKYFGSVVDVEEDAKASRLIWKICLNNNPDSCLQSDGETPVNGVHLVYNNWLPRPGDETTPAKNGRGTKAETKLRMFADFLRGMQITAKTPEELAEALLNKEWVGIDVECIIAQKEYNGRISNEIKYMNAAIDEAF